MELKEGLQYHVLVDYSFLWKPTWGRDRKTKEATRRVELTLEQAKVLRESPDIGEILKKTAPTNETAYDFKIIACYTVESKVTRQPFKSLLTKVNSLSLKKI